MSFDKSKLKSTVKNINIEAPSTFFGNDDEEERIELLSLSSLIPFKDHPFKVLEDSNMEDLKRSIQDFGVATPIIVRDKENGTFEIVAGHRRVKACTLLALEEIPAIVRDMNDDEAVFQMVDTNIQREQLLPSEKAFAYKMKLEASKRSAGRPKRNCVPVGHNFSDGGNNSGVPVGHNFSDGGNNSGVPVGHNFSDGENNPGVPVGHNFSDGGNNPGVPVGHNFSDGENNPGVPVGHNLRSREVLAQNSIDSSVQIQRYIRLTYLTQELLQYTDEKKIPFRVAVELSYLSKSEQESLFSQMITLKSTPNMVQASKLRKFSKEEKLTQEVIESILLEGTEKKTRVSLKLDIAQYFPEKTSKAEMEQVILELIKNWKEGQ